MRHVYAGDSYTDDEDALLDIPDSISDPPPETLRGEPWGWTKPGPRPRGWPGPDNRRDYPGPYDGSWEVPE